MRGFGLLAATLVRLSGYGPLGFSSLDDYSRERLGLSGRELQDLATVARRLESLPLIGDAFDRGEISWSQTRLLAAVARPETEGGWLSWGQNKTVEALRAGIQRWREAQSRGSSPEARGDEDDGHTGDDRPAPEDGSHSGDLLEPEDHGRSTLQRGVS